MELDATTVHRLLDRIAVHGWDGPDGRELLTLVREAVVVPAVRRSGLRGPAADQAASSAWSAAWDALRRPSAMRADNPGGMVCVAVRRALRDEVAASSRAAPARASVVRPVSLDAALDAGVQIADPPGCSSVGLGQGLESIAAALIAIGWAPGQLREVIAHLADGCSMDRAGGPATRWRWVAMRLDLPEWQVRRLAVLLVGVDGSPGLLQLVRGHGVSILGEPAIRGALRATWVADTDGPRAHLETAVRLHPIATTDRGRRGGDRLSA